MSLLEEIFFFVFVVYHIETKPKIKQDFTQFAIETVYL